LKPFLATKKTVCTLVILPMNKKKSLYSVSCGLSAAPDGTGDGTGIDRPVLFYDVFDTHFELNSPKRHDILKILIKNVIKQPGPIGAGLVTVHSGQGLSVPVSVGAGLGRSVPVGAVRGSPP
jgi:hypothetical protein